MTTQPIDRRIMLRVLPEKEEQVNGVWRPEHEHDLDHIHAYKGEVLALAADCNRKRKRTKVAVGDIVWYSPFTGAETQQSHEPDIILFIEEDRVLCKLIKET